MFEEIKTFVSAFQSFLHSIIELNMYGCILDVYNNII